MFLALLLACTDAVPLADGDYVLDHATDGSGVQLGEAEVGALALTIDTAADTAVLTVTADDSAETITLALVERDPADWIVGCPTNYTSARMETFDLGATLDIGPLRLTDAVLAAGCDGDDTSESPVIAGSSGTALSEPMVWFTPA